MNAAVYFGVRLLSTVSILLVDIQGLEGRLHGLERQGDVALGPKGFADTSQFPVKRSSKHRVVHNFEWKRGELKRRTFRPANEVLLVNASEEPRTLDASGESHGPRMVDVASHLLTDYGIMGVSGEEDSAKWAADQIQNSTKGSKELNGNLVDTVEWKLLKNDTAPQYQSSTLQASNSTSATQANTSENRQSTNLLKNLTLNIQRGLNKSLDRQANQSLNRNQTNLVAEPKSNHSDSESNGDGSLAVNFESLRPNQSFQLKFPASSSAVSVSNRNSTFSANKEVEDISQETSGLLENTEPENDINSLDRNTSSAAKGTESDSVTADLKPGNGSTNMIVTTVEDISSNDTASQPSNDRIASDALNLQGQSRELQNSTGVEKAKLEVYDDESLAKALTDTSVSSIVFSNKSLSPDNYILAGEGQKKSTLQGEQSKMKKHPKDEHERNAVRKYFKAKIFSTNERQKLTLESLSHMFSKKNSMVQPPDTMVTHVQPPDTTVTHVQPPELIQVSKNVSRSNTEHIIANGEENLKENDSSHQMKAQSNNTAQVPSTGRPGSYGADDKQGNALSTAPTLKFQNYQAPPDAAALHFTSSDVKKNESRIVPSADPYQGSRKYNHEFLNNVVSGNKHENVTTSVLIQDDSGRTVYQGAVDIFKARNNVSNINSEENQAVPSIAFTPNEIDQNSHETSFPEVKVVGQNEMTSKIPSDAKFHKEASNPYESIPSNTISIPFAKTPGHDSNLRQDVNYKLTRNSSSHGMQQQSVDSESQEQNTEPSAGETSDHRPLSGPHQQLIMESVERPKESNDYDPRQQTNFEPPLQQQQNVELVEKPKETKEQYDPRQQTNFQPPLQQQQNENLPQNIQHETRYPDDGEPQDERPLYEDDNSNFKEDVFHIVLHNSNKVIRNPHEHMTLTISGPLPTGVEVPGKSDGLNPNFQVNAENVQTHQNANQLDKVVVDGNSFSGNSANSGFLKTSKSTEINRSDDHVQINQEKVREDGRKETSNQTNTENAGNAIQGKLSKNNPNSDQNKQEVEQSMSGSHVQGDVIIDSPLDQNSTSFAPTNERFSSNMLVKATDRATASLSPMNGLASNDEIAAMEGPRMTGGVPTANPASRKLDCHVGSQPGKSSLTILTCRKKKFDSNTPQAFKPTFYYPQVDEGLKPSRKTQERVPRLDEVLNVLNQDTKESLNKEMMMEGKSIENMLQGFANPKVTMYDSSDVGTDDDSLFNWIPENHKRNSDNGFVRAPWEMRMKSRALWDPEHRIMLPNSLLKNYWRHLRRARHRHHRPRFPWAPVHESQRGFWGFHPHIPLEGYGHFVPSWAPNGIWSHPGHAFHQENASKRTSLFNNILKGDRDNCRPHAGGLHSHMSEWEYLGRVLCSCPFGVGEW